MKANLKYIIILLLCFVILIFIEISRPRPVDWSHSFSKDHKKPYGSYVLFEIFKNIFHDRDFKESELTIYRTVLGDSNNVNTNYILINNTFHLNIFEANKLMKFVHEGNTAFIVANSFHGHFADSLNLETDLKLSYADSVSLNFVNPSLKSDEYFQLKPNEGKFYFSKFDTANSVILGVNNNNRVTFIKTKFGNGTFYFSSVPIIYTNYYLLHLGFAEYIAKSLSYLQEGNIIWDEYYKVNKRIIETPLRFILSNESLKWAYYLVLAGFLLFLIFRSKRMQRMIPVITTNRNTSLEFISIISKLYFHAKDHKGIAQKRVLYFLDFVRSQYYLKTNKFTRN